jgi:hypothetical protein
VGEKIGPSFAIIENNINSLVGVRKECSSRLIALFFRSSCMYGPGRWYAYKEDAQLRLQNLHGNTKQIGRKYEKTPV